MFIAEVFIASLSKGMTLKYTLWMMWVSKLLCLSAVEDLIISQYNLSALSDTLIESTVSILLKTVTMGTEIYEETHFHCLKQARISLCCVLQCLVTWYILAV